MHSCRIPKQRAIRRILQQQPIVELSRKESVEQRLVEYMQSHDVYDLLTFGAWWKNLDGDELGEIQFPHGCHGLVGTVSNHSKQDVGD